MACDFRNVTLPNEACELAYFRAIRGPMFCSMQITRDMREEAAVIAEREKGLAAKSAEFMEKGAEIYVRG
jgi:phosphomethylpyrimidine synthase